MTDRAAPTAQPDIRPVVATKSGAAGPWLFAGVLVIGGIALFSSLEAHRTVVSSPAISGRLMTSGAITSPPELSLPVPYGAPDWYQAERYRASVPLPGYLQRAPIERRDPGPRAAQPAPQARVLPGAQQIQDYMQPAPYAGQTQLPVAPSESASVPKDRDDRVRATRLLNPATTVPQGTVVQAVLETALDSTRPGYARAVVSRDVFGFDGTRILIPRGAKLFGEYNSEVSSGQNRALIQWHRLTRPDGTIIDVNSPSADPLGRAGVRGKVDSHFLQRFSGTILQSVLDVGVQLAARKASGNTVILGLPSSTQQSIGAKPEEIRPTLRIRQGTSVSVFVAKDLDFTDVER